MFSREKNMSIVDTYFSKKKGDLRFEDFVSILLLLEHHDHIDVDLGYYIELNPLL